MKQRGCVTLIGAGPGDPALITLAGFEALRSAEVILQDRLAAEELLRHADPSAEIIDVGKEKGNHPTPQAEINSLILKYALEGKRVVRLKGGDPYLFGRGAEELELLQKNNIPFKVIPGVTSAIAAPAYAGIPVTHREYSSSLHILTGHGKNGESPKLPFTELAKLGGTLVFLMGLAALQEICDGLVAAGMDPETPAALIENGTRPEQRRIVGTLRTLPEQAEREKFVSPAITVVGKVCLLAERFDFTAHLPLWGKRVLVASSRTTNSRLAGKLRDLGAAVDDLSAITTEDLPLPEDFRDRLADPSWLVLTSRSGVERFFKHLDCLNFDLRRLAHLRIAAVGPGTADSMKKHGIVADLVPEEFNSEALTAALMPHLTPQDRVLLFRAKECDRTLDQALEEAGIPFENVAAYETRRTPRFTDLVQNRLQDRLYDAVTFSSASSVEAFANVVKEFAPDFNFEKLPAVAIGEITAAAALKHGITCEVADSASLDGIVNLLLKKWNR